MDNLVAGRFLSAVFAGTLDTQIKARLVLPCNWNWNWRHPCPSCGNLVRAKSTALCKSCRMASMRVPVACSWCGHHFPKLASELIRLTSKRGYQHFFCNRSCFGHWFAVEAGFLAHPENTRLGSARTKGVGRKWGWGQIQALASERFWGPTKVARELGMPLSTVSSILHELRKAGRLEARGQNNGPEAKI